MSSAPMGKPARPENGKMSMSRLFLIFSALIAAACAQSPSPAVASQSSVRSASQIITPSTKKRGGLQGVGTSTYGTDPALGVPVTYDAHMGTSTDTVGLTTFGLHPGSRRVWCNSTQADDTGNGLSAATAQKTLPACQATFRGAGFSPGDQLMLAGTGGRSYADNGLSGGWSGLAGVSATYPTAILSYDPADAANATKYGHLYGSNRPIYVLSATGPPLLSNNSNDGANNFAVQGLIIDSQNADSSTFGTTYVHNNLAFQNNLFKQVALQFSAAGGTNTGINISKNGFYGAWRAFDGNTNAIFADGFDGSDYIQNNVFAHAGWEVGASRSDQTAYGGPSVFGHAVYHPAHNMGGHYDRNVYIDSASDGWGIRGYAAMTQPVSIDEPIVGAFSGFSGGADEAPNGVVDTVDDFAAIGGDNLTTDPINGGRGEGPGINNTIAPSYMHNGVLLDNPQMNNGNSWIIGITYKYPGQITPMVLAMDKIRAWNYSYRAQSTGYAGIYTVGTINVTWTNSLLDTLFSDQTGPPSTGTISGVGVRTWAGGDYPSPMTKAGLITALGFADKASMVNAMLDFPQLPWAQAIIGEVFPGVGATPYYATAPPPVLTGLPTPTVVYSSDTTAPTLSTLTVSGVGATTATLNSTTNDGTGWLYEVVSTSGTPPNQFQMGNSQDSTGSTAPSAGRQAVSASGAQTYSITGLTSGATYFAYEVQQDPAGNRSSILSSSSFTTSSGTTWSVATTNADWTISGNQITRTGSGTTDAMARASTAKTNGTVAYTINNAGSGWVVVGFDTTGAETQYPGHDLNGDSIGYFNDGRVFLGGSLLTTVATYGAGDVISEDKVGASIVFKKNGTTVYTAAVGTDPVSGSAFPAAYNHGTVTGAQLTADFSGW